MKIVSAIIFFVSTILLAACTESSSIQEEKKSDTITFIMDTSNQYIYDFMRVVVQDQHLSYDRGLSLSPESSIDVNGNDKSFLTTLLKGEKELLDKPIVSKVVRPDTTHAFGDSTKKLSDSVILIRPPEFKYDFSGSIIGGLYEKCLTKKDISFMLAERERLKDFIWNNQRLGFNLSNENNWYEFSLPYFSRDRKTAIIVVRDLCKPFLCGSGSALLYQYKDGHWTSSKVRTWIH
jgi:hypothetical protein